MKKILFVFAVIVFVSCGKNKNDNERVFKKEDVELTTNTLDTAKWIADKISEMKKDSIKLIATNYRSITTNSEMSLAIDYLKYCSSWNEFIENNQDILNGNKVAEKLANQLTIKSNSTLNSILPSYRKAFASNLAAGLWERDIYVTSSGGGNNILNVTGGIFAANANIKDFHEILRMDAKHYGFKQIRYRWYKGASEYTYYEL